MKSGFFTKKRLVVGSIVLIVILLAGGGIALAQMMDRIMNKPGDLFNDTAAPGVTAGPTGEPSPTGSPDATVDPSAGATPTVDPLEELQGRADPNIAKEKIVNVLLIGVDYATERDNNPKEYVGKYFNSDVMLVLAINFEKNKVDMISVPRDSYAKIANQDGIYKLNFSLTAGGGINDKGFMNVCDSIEYMLGGNVPIDHYIAVTMPVVKELTDAVGGVEYDVDVEFTMMGRHYKKGLQHMDGQAVLDYCRVRKNVEQSGDLNRVNRQKKMLVAVFQKLQSTSSILTVPKILTSMKDKVYTNLSFEQLAALALFGKDVPIDQIAMRTMTGTYDNIFNRNYVLINQKKRIDLIKEVWGETVASQYEYDPGYAKLLWAYMQGEGYIKKIQTILVKDGELGEAKKFADPLEYDNLLNAIASTSNVMAKYKNRLYSDKKPTVKADEYKELETSVETLYSVASTMFKKYGYSVNWYVDVYKPGQFRMKE